MKQEVFILKKKILNKKQCNLLIDEYESRKNNSLNESCLNANTAKMITSTFKKVDLIPETKSFNIVHKAIGTMIKLWVNKIKKEKTGAWFILKNKTTFAHLYRLMCYEKGGWIHPHIDFEDFSYASCTINLNEEYKGGVFYFFNRRIRYSLKQGESIIFPNNPFWVHEVSEVRKGKRYSVNCFLNSLPYDVQVSVNEQVNKERQNILTKTHPYKHENN
jgi:hypothetical protein